MKFYDYKCPKCGYIIKDVEILDGEQAPEKLKCPECGKFAKRVFGAVPYVPIQHRA